MKEKYNQIWELALPYLKAGVMKDFVLHTKGVISAMEIILQNEKSDENILIPAAILHDTGWSRVPAYLQRSKEPADKRKAMELHLEYAAPIISVVLTKLNYTPNQIQRIIEIVKAHKFQDPTELDKQLLIDADSTADAFKDQFYSDVKSYGTTPLQAYEYRKQNKFYTTSATKLFANELENRRKEFQN